MKLKTIMIMTGSSVIYFYLFTYFCKWVWLFSTNCKLCFDEPALLTLYC